MKVSSVPIRRDGLVSCMLMTVEDDMFIGRNDVGHAIGNCLLPLLSSQQIVYVGPCKHELLKL